MASMVLPLRRLPRHMEVVSAAAPCRHMAGHNKWSKIKRDKTANDQQKGKLFTKLARELSFAARDAKGNMEDSRLLVALQKVKSMGLPKANIERAMSTKSQEEKGEIILVEAMGPGKTAILVECLTESRIRTATEVRKLMFKNGGSPADIAYIFDRKGVVTVKTPLDEAMDAAIEAGGEDVVEAEDGCAQVICGFAELMIVKDRLADAGLDISSFGHEYRPNMTVPITEEADSEQLSSLLELIESHDDVVAVYHNGVDG